MSRPLDVTRRPGPRVADPSEGPPGPHPPPSLALRVIPIRYLAARASTMDSYDSHRSNVPARLAAQRPVVPATVRPPGELQESAMPSPISLRVALRGVRRYWWMILTLWIVGSAGLWAAIYMRV